MGLSAPGAAVAGLAVTSSRMIWKELERFGGQPGGASLVAPPIKTVSTAAAATAPLSLERLDCAFRDLRQQLRHVRRLQMRFRRGLIGPSFQQDIGTAPLGSVPLVAETARIVLRRFGLELPQQFFRLASMPDLICKATITSIIGPS